MPSDKVSIGADPIELDVMRHYLRNDERKIPESGLESSVLVLLMKQDDDCVKPKAHLRQFVKNWFFQENANTNK